ncbi:hypothetical protein CHUAL_000010 [Chamberlinius hualienensis]
MVCCGCGLVLFAVAIVLWRLFDRWYRRDFIPDFNSKYVFITGTDSGFGHKLAIDLDKLGVNIYAGCFTKHGASELKRKASPKLKTVEVDITNQDSVDKAKEFIENDLSPGKALWALVNNAGILGNIDFQLATVDDYRKVMDVNFFGQIRVTEAFLPLLKRSKGRIVQVASMFGRGTVSTAPYTCSKWAVEPYADELRRFVRQYGVSVSTIEPGFYGATSLTEEAVWIDVLKRKWETLSDQKKAEIGHDYLDTFIKFYKQAFKDFPLASWNKIEFVTDSMIHALGAQHPKTRYLIGYDARPYIVMTNFTPDWFLDGLLRFAYGVSKFKANRNS